MPRHPPAHNALLNGVLLHGRLEATIERAEQLWETGARSTRERVVRALASGSTINPYVTVRLEQLPRYKRLLKTEAIRADDAPVWNYHTSVDVASVASFVVVHVKTSGKNDQSGLITPHKSLGFVRLRAQDVLLNVVDGWYTLAGHQGLTGQGKAAVQSQPGQHAQPGVGLGPAGTDRKNRGRIKIKIQYWPVDAVLTAVSDRMPTVPGTYFRATDGCHVNFFQDAHCPHPAVLDLPGSSDAIYDPPDEDGANVAEEQPCADPPFPAIALPTTTVGSPVSPPSDGDLEPAAGRERGPTASFPEMPPASLSYQQQALPEDRIHAAMPSVPCEASLSRSSSSSSRVCGMKDSFAANELGENSHDFDVEKRADLPTAPPKSSVGVDDSSTVSNVPFPRSSNYFEEIYRAIFHARKLVYITGWSVDTTIQLLREAPKRPIAELDAEAGSAVMDLSVKSLDSPEKDDIAHRYSAGNLQQMRETKLAEATAAESLASDPVATAGLLPLGELLKRKADSGVRVLLLVWDEVFSTNRPLLRWMSLMDTKDEVTREFFKKTRVKAAVVPRIGRAGRKAAILTSPIVPCMFTFHEKLIITDIPLKTGNHLSREEELALKEDMGVVGEDDHPTSGPDSLKHLLRSRFPNLPNMPNRPHLPNLDKSTLSHLRNLDKLRDLPSNIPGMRSHNNHHGHSTPSASQPSSSNRNGRGVTKGGSPGHGSPSSASNSLSNSDLGVVDREVEGAPLKGGEQEKNSGEASYRPPRMPGALRALMSNRKRAISNSSDQSVGDIVGGGAVDSSSTSAARVEVSPSAPPVLTAASAAVSSREMLSQTGVGGSDAPVGRAVSFGGAFLSSNQQDSPLEEVGNETNGRKYPPPLSGETGGSGPSSKQLSQSFHIGECANPEPASESLFPVRSARTSVLSPRLQNARQHIAAHQLTIPNLQNLPNPRTQPTPASVTGERRQLTAFIGGLDVTYGRFDTPEHSLFRSLNTTHKDDFHNACFDVASPVGPREPWHDVGATVTGPVVRDFVSSFEERWRRQGRGVSHLVDVANDKEIHDGRFAHDAEQWSVQVFRSIDERSAVFRRGEERLLETKKGRQVDRSIHHAYVHYTRTAKRFIYIEQQYFIGSSNQWLSYSHNDATNLVPYEIALRIVASIRAEQPLRVYVVIPMWPEGLAADTTIQKILFFQFKTVEMMYSMVAEAIADQGLVDTHPTDYLNFFCLGNREDLSPTTPSNASCEGGQQPCSPDPPSCPDVTLSGLAASPPGNPPPPSTRGSPSGSESAPTCSNKGSVEAGISGLQARTDRRRGSRWPWNRASIPRGAPSTSGSSSVLSRRGFRLGRSLAGSETSSVPSGLLPASASTSSVGRAGPDVDAVSSSSSDRAMAAVNRSSGNQVGAGNESRIQSPLPRTLSYLQQFARRASRSGSQVDSVGSVRSGAAGGGVPSPVFPGTREASCLSAVPSLSLSREESKQRIRKPRRGDEDALSKSRRHPIYQHAKLFIRDDEVAVCGSANLNERSMSGVRDTEMAIGSFQPKHTFAHLKAQLDADADIVSRDVDNPTGERDGTSELPLPRGEVSRFRKRLWAEHALGPTASEFPSELDDPGTLKCVRTMREIGKRNWEAYSGDDVVEMQAHLILYPYEVSKTGVVSGVERFFPDTKGRICGTPNDVIPNILTS